MPDLENGFPSLAAALIEFIMASFMRIRSESLYRCRREFLCFVRCFKSTLTFNRSIRLILLLLSPSRYSDNEKIIFLNLY